LLSYSAKWFTAKFQRINIKGYISDFVGRALVENLRYWNRSTLWSCEEWVQNIGHKTGKEVSLGIPDNGDERIILKWLFNN
jgi:hypothetical protein